MLFINETPLHFGVILLICIIFLLFALIGIAGILRSETPSASSFAGFLTVAFGFLAFIPLLASVYNLPATATASELFPYYLAAYYFVGIQSFFLVFYLLGLSWFKQRIWAVFLPILGTFSWFTLLWFLVTPASVVTVSDGLLNYIVMPLNIILYSGVLAFFYLFLIPLVVLYRVAREREGSMKTWTWIGWFGLLLWFIGVMLMALVQFVAPFMPYIFILGAIAWLIMLISWYITSYRS